MVKNNVGRQKLNQLMDIIDSMLGDE